MLLAGLFNQLDTCYFVSFHPGFESMLKNTKKLFLIAFATILLPIILFVVYETSSLQEDEQVLQTIYENQLDFIIFSANQYSNDFLDNLVNSIEGDLTENGFQLSEKTRSLTQYSGCTLFRLESIGNAEVDTTYYPEDLQSPFILLLDSINRNNQNLIQQLQRYRQSGYRKIEPGEVVLIDNMELQVLQAVLVDPSGNQYLFSGLIEPVAFAVEVLSPKLQEIAQEDIAISLVNDEQALKLFLTDSVSGEVIASKRMWLFPTMKLAISLKNQTLKELINQRLEYNLLASGILIILLLIGFIMVGRTIYQQMQLAQTKSDFVSNVSHELRTPLALISMFAETLLLQRVKKEEKKSEYIEIIFKETNRLTRIVNRILNFSQVEADRKKYHFLLLDLNTVVDELMHDYSFHLEQNGFEFSVDLWEEPLDTNVDKESVYEALVNLIDNAIKYSKSTKKLHISTELRGENAVIAVSDSGIGIPREKIKQIFDKFYRVAESNIHDVQGAGLGLSLVSSIMEAHEGNVEVDSKTGEGSTFRLVFKINPK